MTEEEILNSPFFKRLSSEVGDICKANPDLLKKREEPDFLLGIYFQDGSVHCHYPDAIPQAAILKVILEQNSLSLGAEKKFTPKLVEKVPLSGRKIVFSHRRALGDGLMFTAGIRDFKLLFPHIEIGVDSNMPMLWENNPYVNPELKRDQEGVEFYGVGYPMGDVDHGLRHFTNMFLMDMIAQVDEHAPLTDSAGNKFPLWKFCLSYANGGVGDPSLCDPEKNPEAREPFISVRAEFEKLGSKGFLHQNGDIHLSEKEKQTNIIKDVYGIDKYWVIAPGGKRDATCKIWDWRQFQKVIDHFEGVIKFVTIGRSDHLIEKLNGVIDLVDKFRDKDERGLVPLVYHSEGCVAGPSFLNHFAAAMPGKPPASRKACVVLWGGREPSGWCYYTNHQILHTNGIFSCCDNGGCWKARTIPLQKDPEHNKNLCKQPVMVEGVTVPACMHAIKSEDVIRAIEKYYEGDLYSMAPTKSTVLVRSNPKITRPAEIKVKKINLLGNLNTSGGGEQSMCKIADVLEKAGWDVVIHPWGSIEERFKDRKDISEVTFESGKLAEAIRPDIPLLFYANDCVWDFSKLAEPIVQKASSVMVGINFMNGDLPKCPWLARSGKLKSVVFQSSEKKGEWIRDALGMDAVGLYVIAGAIDLSSMLEVCPPQRKKDETLVILKHGKADARKYVTEETKGKGKKVHVWQHNFGKDTDVKFYGRLLKDIKNVRFEFMEAPKELQEAFKNEARMVFHPWSSIPVTEFLSRGHLYLDRASNDWRHQYPRTIGEALAVGLPVLCEPRDGPLDRVLFGDSGFYCVDYDQYRECILKLQRKEEARQRMGRFAKDWARTNLRPENWVDLIEATLI